LIVFDASAVVSAALKIDSIPERALLRAEEADVFALSIAVEQEIAAVLSRPKFARAIPLERRSQVLDILRSAAIWFDPVTRIMECRDPKDDKYLELALAAGAETIVSGDEDLLVFSRGAVFVSSVRATISRSRKPVHAALQPALFASVSAPRFTQPDWVCSQ